MSYTGFSYNTIHSKHTALPYTVPYTEPHKIYISVQWLMQLGCMFQNFVQKPSHKNKKKILRHQHPANVTFCIYALPKCTIQHQIRNCCICFVPKFGFNIPKQQILCLSSTCRPMFLLLMFAFQPNAKMLNSTILLISCNWY